jgi:hypothetical protein
MDFTDDLDALDGEPAELREEELSAPAEVLEPLSDWLHVQPSAGDQRAGRIVLPPSIGDDRLARSMVLATGEEVTDVHVGDIVYIVSSKTVDMRDGSSLVQRKYVVARVQ